MPAMHPYLYYKSHTTEYIQRLVKKGQAVVFAECYQMRTVMSWVPTKEPVLSLTPLSPSRTESENLAQSYTKADIILKEMIQYSFALETFCKDDSVPRRFRSEHSVSLAQPEYFRI